MRWLVRIVVGLVALVAVVAGAGYLWMRGSLPQLDGTIIVASPDAPVEVVRDRNGVPHIRARSDRDAAFALGFVHAQDRFWQMEFNRRLGAGRLSEAVGAATLQIDRYLRTLGVYHVAEQNYANLDGETRAVLESYAKGVNAWLATRGPFAPLPPEFLVLGIDPEPWRPADSLVWGKMMAFSLSANLSSELLRARLAARLTPEQVADLFPPYPEDGPGVLAEHAALYRTLPLERWASAVALVPDPGNGSNNWVVSGARSASGKPLLADDPHLGLSVPSIWYLAHISTPDHDIVGATLPGIPAVIIGRNQAIGWGFTNTGPDVQDLFIEKLDAADPTRYLAPDGSRPFAVREEIIRVKDGETVRLAVRSTRHGPVVSDVSEDAAAVTGEGHVLALAWTALDPADTTARAMLRLPKARNWDEFVAALRDYQGPQQSMVYADTGGRIGMYAPARVPVRKRENEVRGRAPVPGWDSRYDWAGFIPFEELPHVVDPPTGAVATANHRIVGPDYPHFITSEWEEPYRARRIAELLGQTAAHTPDSFAALQMDVVSTMAQDFLPLLLRVPPAAGPASRAHELMAHWNGAMEADAPQPLIFAAWYRHLSRLIAADELGDLYADLRQRPLFVRDALTAKQA